MLMIIIMIMIDADGDNDDVFITSRRTFQFKFKRPTPAAWGGDSGTTPARPACESGSLGLRSPGPSDSAVVRVPRTRQSGSLGLGSLGPLDSAVRIPRTRHASPGLDEQGAATLKARGGRWAGSARAEYPSPREPGTRGPRARIWTLWHHAPRGRPGAMRTPHGALANRDCGPAPRSGSPLSPCLASARAAARVVPRLRRDDQAVESR